MTALPIHLLTYNDVLTMPGLERRELIEGALFVSPAPRWQQQDIAFELAILFRAIGRPLGGKVLVSPVDVVLSTLTMLQPDIVYLSPARRSSLTESGVIAGTPDIVVEVVSPSSIGTDRVRKSDMYARAGVPEYWIVKPANRRMVVHSLKTGRYRVLPAAADGAVRSLVLPDLTVHPGRFFGELLG